MTARLRAAGERLAVLGLALSACGGDESRPPPSGPAGGGGREAASVPPPPDAGTSRGHGADAGTVRVPEQDATPPRAGIALDGVEDGILTSSRYVAVATGADPDSGVARVRVSVHERLTCRGAAGTFVRRRQRYFPPPQVARVRAARGARLRTRASRTRRLAVSAGRCGRGASLEAAVVEVWGEATNGLGLETVTHHLRARHQP